jgi:hypothetical protein
MESEAKESLRRRRYRREDNSEINLKESVRLCAGLEWLRIGTSDRVV